MMGNFGQANYAAAKAGIYGFTRTVAIELQKQRITVNAIAPIAKTRLTEDLPMFQTGKDALTPDHIAPAALFLASDLCADRTGHVLAVAGAQDVRLQGRRERRQVQGRARRRGARTRSPKTGSRSPRCNVSRCVASAQRGRLGN